MKVCKSYYLPVEAIGIVDGHAKAYGWSQSQALSDIILKNQDRMRESLRMMEEIKELIKIILERQTDD